MKKPAELNREEWAEILTAKYFGFAISEFAEKDDAFYFVMSGYARATKNKIQKTDFGMYRRNGDDEWLWVCDWEDICGMQE